MNSVRRDFCGFLFAAGIGLCALAGCGGSDRPDTYPVTGTLTLNGKPVEGAEISFYGEGAARVAGGRTNADGKYSLTTFETNDGAVAGDHVVTIVKRKPKGEFSGPMDAENPGEAYGAAMEAAASGEPDALTIDELPVEYASKDSSTLKRTVIKDGGDQNTFSFDLTGK